MKVRNLCGSLCLKWRLILVVSLLLVVSCAALSVFLISEFSASAVKSLERYAASLSKNLAHNAEFGVMLEIKPELDVFSAGLVHGEDVIYVQIYNKKGVLLSEGLSEGITPARIRPFSESLVTTGTAVFSSSLLDGGDVIDAVSLVRIHTPELSREELGSTIGLIEDSDSKSEAIGYARVGVGLASTYATIKSTTRLIIIYTIFVVVLGVLISVTLVRMLSRPIDKMVAATELIAAGDLSQRVEVTAYQELARLAIAFNQMCDSLQQTQHEIELYNQTLEQKIRERTQELEKAQKQVVQSEKMVAVGQLAAGVAHELNNPLGGILGYAQFGLEKLSKGKMEENDLSDYQRYLADIEQQARRCKAIVKNLLKFSRSSTDAEFEYFDVNAVLEETFVFSAHQLDMNDIKLTRKLAADLPPVYGNANLLQQVFANILINAMQSMPGGGDLYVETRHSTAVGDFRGTVEIVFQDMGVGITSENLTKIFEPFFTTKKVGEGTGLGLAVSYGIVKDHGGDIRIDSVVDEGSTFTVILPIVEEMVRSNAID